MRNLATEQELFWAGDFGNHYTLRNREIPISPRIMLFGKILSRTRPLVNSILEFGANIGINIYALKSLLPEADFSAVEINSCAITELKKIESLNVYHQSILDFKVDRQRDFVFTSGVLIHINPDVLYQVYQSIYTASSKYICLIEYYNPTPISINYRGYDNKLFKRDFAGDMLDQYPDLHLVDYGFCYRRDNFYYDDTNWFLLEKLKR